MVQPSSELREKPGSTTWILLAIVMVPQLGLTLVNPSNAAIAQDVGTQISTVEGTLTVYMVGYALSMFASGSLADRFHASRLQSAGLGLFTLGSVVAATAPSVGVLGIGRFLQALGGTSATVLCRIIVQRRFAAEARVDILTSMSMVISLTPSLSPLVGGFTAHVVPWRWLFVALAIFAAALIPTIEFLLGHAVPERPELPTLKQFIAANAQALGNKTFRWHAAAIALVWMTYFGFVSSSTTILQDFLGQSAVCYGMLMAIPAIGYLVGSLIIKRSQDIARAVGIGVGVGAVGIIAAIAGAATPLSDHPLAIVIAMSVTFLGVGATIPYTQAGLLELDLDYPGVSAGLFFFLQMAGGAAFSAVVGALHLPSVPAYLVVLVVPQVVVTAMVARQRLAMS